MVGRIIDGGATSAGIMLGGEAGISWGGELVVGDTDRVEQPETSGRFVSVEVVVVSILSGSDGDDLVTTLTNGEILQFLKTVLFFNNLKFS